MATRGHSWLVLAYILTCLPKKTMWSQALLPGRQLYQSISGRMTKALEAPLGKKGHFIWGRLSRSAARIRRCPGKHRPKPNASDLQGATKLCCSLTSCSCLSLSFFVSALFTLYSSVKKMSVCHRVGCNEIFPGVGNMVPASSLFFSRGATVRGNQGLGLSYEVRRHGLVCCSKAKKEQSDTLRMD